MNVSLCQYACVLMSDHMYMCPYLDSYMHVSICYYVCVLMLICIYPYVFMICTVVAANVDGGKDVAPSGRRRDKVRAGSMLCTIYTHSMKVLPKNWQRRSYKDGGFIQTEDAHYLWCVNDFSSGVPDIKMICFRD